MSAIKAVDYPRRIKLGANNTYSVESPKIPIPINKIKKRPILWDRVLGTLLFGLFMLACILSAMSDIKNPKNPHTQTNNLVERQIKALELQAYVDAANFRDECWKAQHFKLALSPACKEVLSI